MKGLVKTWIALAAGLLFSGMAQAADFSKLTYMTENYPPYNFSAKGVIQGISVDLLLAMGKQAGVPLKLNMIKLYPWARAYNQTLKGPNMVLFATTRTKAREALFKWVGPIANTDTVLLAKKGSGISISSPADMKKYTIGVVKDDVGEQLVKAAGVPAGKIKSSSKPTQVAQKLAKGGFSFLPMSKIART
ncbi:substrate-binding periplasmic protein [Dongshaea marina]|uniref:substrate-binding periplasmic protein n=1 Tax=Dongshaea marina TaxID=2047966 RepID=UPI000D3E2293|nr:transporter substrate-binding domain-containing protein [Dongshaea marina]